MAKTIVIVESPTKARTMTRFLPKEYKIIASVGHVRDLPQSAAEIPQKYKEEQWSKIGVNVANNFEPLYVIPKGKSKIIKELKAAINASDRVILATDEDREGESISWHLVNVLKPKVPIQRMVFHEITATAIKAALNNFRDIDMQLVKAQETRRILDRLFGYTLSPLIWKKVAYGLSAGRVQSPGLRMLVDIERARIRHSATRYWDLVAHLYHKEATQLFEARLVALDDKRLVTSKDFDSVSGERKDDAALLLTKDDCATLQKRLNSKVWQVKSVTEKDSQIKAPIPFITSTLQQHANRKLALSSRETMRVAQRLYESGKITYMRTDSPHLSNEATNAARTAVVAIAGKEFLTEKPKYFRGGTGEAHEAIRPAGEKFTHPKESALSGRELQLYTMIWQRTLATQMKPAIKRGMKVQISVDSALFEATGIRTIFAGFLRVYGAVSSNKTADSERILPALTEGDVCTAESMEQQEHTTRPPARFTEAALIQKLEAEGIGRPSTYASIIATLHERGYVRRERTTLIPTFTGIAVIQLLENHFSQFIDYSFTSNMEAMLDEIARGERDNIAYLDTFYNGKKGLEQSVKQKEIEIDPETIRKISLPQIDAICEVRIGRYGTYIVKKEDNNEEIHASIPEEIAPADLKSDNVLELIQRQKEGPTAIGYDPDTKQPVYLLTGRYGYYFQLGDGDADGEKPKRASLPREYKPSEVTLEIALQLLSLPRVIGIHPDTKKEIIANRGRFGAYIAHDKDTRSLKKEDDVFTVGLARALALLAIPKGSSRRPTLIRNLGKLAGKKEEIALYSGRYGAYLKMGTKNIALPADLRTPENIEKLDLKMIEHLLS